ncbi:MAG: hypothetical protein J6L89_00330 [Clostridia bacterium]|nr:hypothetical protein [Clostridia bacterium]
MKKDPADITVAGEIIDEKYIENKVIETHISGKIHKDVYKSLARGFLPDILAFYESKRGKQKIEDCEN